VRRYERRLLLAFSDIVGSTPYFARFGDVAGRQLHQLHADLIERAALDHGGRIVDTVGDGVFFVFPDVDAGLRAVVAFEQALAQQNARRERAHQLQVRLGLHWGPVLSDGAAVTGDAVHVAARVARAANPGTVFLTRHAFQELGLAGRLHCRRTGVVELKGVADAVELYELDWRDRETFPRSVLIEETGRSLELPQQDIVSFGRLADHDGAPANDIVLQAADALASRSISRWHFELRRGADGLRLRCLSEAPTTLDGVAVPRGVELPVRSGARIGVAGALTLRLVAAPGSRVDDAESRTMVLGGSTQARRVGLAGSPAGGDPDIRTGPG
jgi:class 3 adenylate cyclase